MNIQPLIDSLPAPMLGHVRAVRIEKADDPTSGASGAPKPSTWVGWIEFACPHDDGAGLNFNMDGRVCATYDHNFHRWFGVDQLDEIPGSGYRIVALDVPEVSVVKCRNQLLFHRHQCHEVAVLIQ